MLLGLTGVVALAILIAVLAERYIFHPPSGLAGWRPVLPPFSVIVSSTTCVKRTHSSARRLGSVTHESTVTNVHAPVRAARGGSSGAMIRQSSSSILSRSCLPALEVLGQYVFGAVGMNVGYHRLLTHRSFVSPRRLELSLATLGTCCLEESPTIWATWHRLHHHMAGTRGATRTAYWQASCGGTSVG